MYRPAMIAERPYYLRDDSIACLWAAESALIRAEGEMMQAPGRGATGRMLMDLETIAAVRLDGFDVQYGDLLRLDVVLASNRWMNPSNEQLGRVMERTGLRDHDGLLAAYRYRQALQWTLGSIGPDTKVGTELLLELYARCLTGPVGDASAGGFRTAGGTYTKPAGTDRLYAAPAANMVPTLMEDLCDFMNTKAMTPMAQAALMRFQLEAIQPFDKRTGRMGQLLTHLVLLKRGVLREHITPLSLMAANHPDSHERYLLPYNQGIAVQDPARYLLGEPLVEYHAAAIDMSVNAMRSALELSSNLQGIWRGRLGRIERDSTVERLLDALCGYPLISVGSAMLLSGRCFSSTSGAIKRLCDTSILHPIGLSDRTKTFCAREAYSSFIDLQQLILPVNDQSVDKDGPQSLKTACACG